jgi:predicted helicase
VRQPQSNRDSWVYNSSFLKLSSNIEKTIQFYNNQVEDFKKGTPKSLDAKNISWDSTLERDLEKGIAHKFDNSKIVASQYRPFYKQNLYFDRGFNNTVALIPKIFPAPIIQNLVICVSGVGVTKEFSTIITNVVPDLELIGKSQCFPLYYYEENNATQKGLFDTVESQKYVRRDAISDFILERAKQQYGKSVTREDIFYYVYGFLHSKEYRETFANDLKKMLPRLPLVENVKDFWAFSKAGRQLAELHLNYENIVPYPDVTVTGDNGTNYTVAKMRFPKKDQKDSIIYNSHITISNIPAKAYEYVVNGKSAIEWIMERYQITTHKESGITNDPNDWAIEVGKPRYILDLLLSIINVSVQTVDIVNALPRLDFEVDIKNMKTYQDAEDFELGMAADE